MKKMKAAFSLAFVVGLVFALAGCSTTKSSKTANHGMKQMTAQSALKPVKGGPAGVELGGYCPVAYHMAHKPIRGKQQFAASYQGKTYYMANAMALKAFKKMPANFMVKYDGWCATGMAMGKKLQADPTIFTVYKGTTYLFSSKMAKAKFDKNPDAMIKMADKHWASMQ